MVGVFGRAVEIIEIDIICLKFAKRGVEVVANGVGFNTGRFGGYEDVISSTVLGKVLTEKRFTAIGTRGVDEVATAFDLCMNGVDAI